MSDEIPQNRHDFALVLAAGAGVFLEEILPVADVYGVSLTLTHVMTAFLAVGTEIATRPLTRDEWVEIYDVYTKYAAETNASKLTAVEQAAKKFTSPADVANAATHEEAAAGAAAWADRVSNLAFGQPIDFDFDWHEEEDGPASTEG